MATKRSPGNTPPPAPAASSTAAAGAKPAPATAKPLAAATGKLPEDEWRALIAAVPAPPTVSPTTFVKGPIASFSKPVVLDCSDNVTRMVKGLQAGGRALFNDNAIGRLATALNAPAPPVAVLDLPQALIDAEPRLKHMPAGLCHANQFHDGCSERLGVDHATLPANRSRFARLAILYGWVHANDRQLIYPMKDPRLVWSVDHGHFLGDVDWQWTPSMLKGRGPAEPEPWIVSGATVTPPELDEAAAILAKIDHAAIAEAVGSPPAAWGVSADDRLVLAQYLGRRRDELLARLGYDVKEK